MDLVKTIEINKLFDFYGALLTEKQQKVIKDYYFYNTSLSEISENLNISRQAVRDCLVKAENALKKFEYELGLIKIYEKQQQIIEQMQKNCNSNLLKEILMVWEK